MRRSEKNKIVRAAPVVAEDPRKNDPARAGARQEWAAVRKAAREAFLAKRDWVSILNEFKEREGFYTPAERERLCREYSEELINNAFR